MTDIALDKQTLLALFQDEANFGICEDGRDGQMIFPDGTAAAMCTNWAIYVRRVLGDRAAIYGFGDDENPDSEIAQTCGGHDFALVDDRFIVDPWDVHYEGLHTSAVLDLQDPAETDKIAQLYGPRENWKRSSELEKEIDAESGKMRSRHMEGTRFPLELLAPANTEAKPS